MDLLYVDYAATTPVDPRVLDAMMPYLTSVYYNATSAHIGVQMAQASILGARAEVARHIGAHLDEVYFTSGATEAINIAIQGLVGGEIRRSGRRRTIVSVRSEHVAVRDAVQRAEEDGFTVIWLPVDSDGRIVMSEAERLIDESVLLVSIMMVNNETGVLQDVSALSELAHSHGALFMTDATQAYGKVPIDVQAMGIDLLAFSGHKVYGPKGIGALYVRRSLAPSLRPLMVGGGQEGGVRSGTQNVPGIIGLATAGRIALQSMREEMERISSLRSRFESAMAQLPEVTINSSGADRMAAISSVTFGTMPAELLLVDMPEIACSKGSACSTSKPTPSPVMLSMGRTPEQAHATVRFSFGRNTTDHEIDRLIQTVSAAVMKRLELHDHQ